VCADRSALSFAANRKSPIGNSKLDTEGVRFELTIRIVPPRNPVFPRNQKGTHCSQRLTPTIG
jgi:hypothetical protein